MRLLISTGGKGERLYPLTKDIPKPMVHICGKPVLHHLVDWAKKNEINEIIMLNGHKAEKVVDYFKDGSSFQIKIIHSNEPQRLGSGGAVRYAKKYIEKRCAYISGDVICEVDLKKMEKFHETKNAHITVLTHKSSHPDDSDILKIDSGNKVTHFISKNDDHTNAGDLTNTGLCIFEPSILNVIDAIEKEEFNIENDLYTLILKRGMGMYAYFTNEFIADIGTFERLKKCEEYLTTKNNTITPQVF